jgi:hypothetical protein
MKRPEQADRHIFRLIILRRNGSEILLRVDDSEPQLPCVRVLPQRRIAAQLTLELNRQCGLRSCCLFVPRDVTHVEGNLEINYAIMESLDADELTPGGMCWRARTTLANLFSFDAVIQTALEEVLEQLDWHGSQSRASHCAKPGWFGRLTEWVQVKLLPLGRELTGDFTQYNASPGFSLIRFETSGPAVWFKATGAPNAHELPVTTLLARLFPQYVPKMIAVEPAWNGWLSEEAQGAPLDQLTAAREWQSVATHLARLQMLSMGKTRDLVAAGCKDLTVPKLASSITPFLAAMNDLMAMQEKKSPPPLSPAQLESLGNDLREACSVFRAADLPDALGHIDFNPGNVIHSGERCVFLDWAEGCVTNPLITFEYLREHFRRSSLQSVEAAEKLTDAYLGLWRSLVPSRELMRAMTVSPLLAVFAYAVTVHWQNGMTRDRGRAVAGHLRALTRRMYAEAARLPDQKRCLA